MSKESDGTKSFNEHFLHAVLRYHTPLVSQEFINSVLAKINAVQQKRHRILTGAAILGFLIALLPILQLLPTLLLLFYPPNSPYIVTLFTLGALSAATWLFVAIFD